MAAFATGVFGAAYVQAAFGLRQLSVLFKEPSPVPTWGSLWEKGALGCPALAYICLNAFSTLFKVTDPEFDLLDELYFVTPFRTLLQKTGLPAAELENQLRSLLEQGLIRSYWPDPDTELAYETTSFGAIARDAAYLASKEGLLQHNTR